MVKYLQVPQVNFLESSFVDRLDDIIEKSNHDTNSESYSDIDDVLEEKYNHDTNSFVSVNNNDISIIANTMNALLGVSIFAMPWGYLQSGVLGGSIMIFLIGLLSYETARVLLVAQRIIYYRTGLIKSYPEIASLTIGGSFWSTIVQVATVISCLGGCIGYLIFLGETLGQMFSMSLLESICYVTVPLILLSWVRSFRNLSAFTILGVVSIIIAILAIIFDGYTRMKGSFSDAPMFLPLSKTLNFLGPATFLFTIHYCVLSMGAEALHDNVDRKIIEKTLSDLNKMESGHIEMTPTLVSEDDFVQSKSYRDLSLIEKLPKSVSLPSASALTKPLIIAYVLSAILISALGAGGFLIYREADVVKNALGQPEPGCVDKVCQNVILNLSPGILRVFVGAALCVSIVLSYIIILAPAREHIELAILKHLYGNDSSDHTITINIIRASLVLFTALTALITPYFGSVLGAVGGLTDAFQSFVLPPLIFLSAQRPRLSSYQVLFYQMILLWGIGTILYTIGTIVNALLALQ